jgi:hypothetical protein
MKTTYALMHFKIWTAEISAKLLGFFVFFYTCMLQIHKLIFFYIFFLYICMLFLIFLFSF